MNRDALERYRTRLESLAAELRRRLEDTESTAPISPDRAIGRLTRVEAMQAQQISLSMRRGREQRLLRVQHALERVAQGTYGTCTKCGLDIAPERLEASPDTFLCIACAERLRAR